MTNKKGSFNLSSDNFDKKKIWKNQLMISFAFLSLSTCYNGMSVLQSSINSQVGTLSLSVVYLAIVLSCLFLPTWIIRRFKEKKTIYLSMLGFSTYIAAQFYPEDYTLIPAGIILGICAAPLWTAQCTYFTKIATQYSELFGIAAEVILTRFFGVFFSIFQLSFVLGNIISATVLRVDAIPVSENDTTRLRLCGASYCQNSVNNSFSLANEVSLTQRYIMSTIFLVFSLLAAVLIFFFVDSIEEKDGIDSELTESSGRLFIATIHHLFRNRYQLLLIPLTIWSGVEQAFIGSDFTAAYVGCGLGVYMIGYVLICYGIADVIGSLVFSYLVKIVGRVPIFTLAAVINIILIIILKEWRPSPSEAYILFILAAGWGFADSIWQAQLNALYGNLFKDSPEAGFSNYRLWESLGFSMSYFFSVLICVETKLDSLIVNLVIAMLFYYVIELNERYKFMRKLAISETITE